jgi:hypothetical protein
MNAGDSTLARHVRNDSNGNVASLLSCPSLRSVSSNHCQDDTFAMYCFFRDLVNRSASMAEAVLNKRRPSRGAKGNAASCEPSGVSDSPPRPRKPATCIKTTTAARFYKCVGVADQSQRIVYTHPVETSATNRSIARILA